MPVSHGHAAGKPYGRAAGEPLRVALTLLGILSWRPVCLAIGGEQAGFEMGDGRLSRATMHTLMRSHKHLSLGLVCASVSPVAFELRRLGWLGASGGGRRFAR